MRIEQQSVVRLPSEWWNANPAGWLLQQASFGSFVLQEATEATEDSEVKNTLRLLCFLLFFGLGVVVF